MNLIIKEAPVYAEYISQVKSDFLLTELATSNEESRNILHHISEEKGDFAYDTGKWTIKEVALHLADSERIFAYRALAFARGEASHLPGYDHEAYVQQSNASGRSLRSIVEEMHNIRVSTIDLFRSLTSEQLSRTGIANGNQVTVQAFGFIIAGHERHHLRILTERYL